MPSLCSPFAMLQCTTVSWKGAFTHMLCPGFYAWCPLFCGCCPEDVPQYLALEWLEKLAYPGSHGTVATGEVVPGRLPPSRHCMNSRLRCAPQDFWERGYFACPEALNWGVDFRLDIHLVAYMDLLSRNIGCGCHLAFSLFRVPAHQYHPKKSLYTHLAS